MEDEVKRPSVADLSKAFVGHVLNKPSGLLDGQADLTGRQRSRPVLAPGTSNPKLEAARLSNGVSLPGAAAPYNLATAHPLVAQLRNSRPDLLEEADPSSPTTPSSPWKRAPAARHDDSKDSKDSGNGHTELVAKIKTRMAEPETGKSAVSAVSAAPAVAIPELPPMPEGPGGVVDDRAWVADWYFAKCDDATIQQTLDNKPVGTFVVRMDAQNRNIFHLSFRHDVRADGSWEALITLRVLTLFFLFFFYFFFVRSAGPDPAPPPPGHGRRRAHGSIGSLLRVHLRPCVPLQRPLGPREQGKKKRKKK